MQPHEEEEKYPATQTTQNPTAAQTTAQTTAQTVAPPQVMVPVPQQMVQPISMARQVKTKSSNPFKSLSGWQWLWGFYIFNLVMIAIVSWYYYETHKRKVDDAG